MADLSTAPPPDSLQSDGLAYGLCALCGLALVLGMMTSVLALSHKHMRREGSLRYVRYSQLILALAHVVTGAGVLLVVLWPEYPSVRALCQAGSFLMLFGALESLWMLMVGATTLLIQMKAATRIRHFLSECQQVPSPRSEHRWSLPIFLLAVLLKAVVLAMLVFLALTQSGVFHIEPDTLSSCRVVRLLGQPTWSFTAALVAVGWTAVIITIVLTLCSVFFYGAKLLRTCRSRYTSSSSSPAASGFPLVRSKGRYGNCRERFTQRLAVVQLVSALLWTVALMSVTVLLFSGAPVVREDYLNISLGYCLVLVLVLSTLPLLAVLLAYRRWRYGGDTSRSPPFDDKEVLLKGSPPATLTSAVKLPQLKEEIRRYRVQWPESTCPSQHGQTTACSTGVLKVYHPACLSKWRAEVRALARLSPSAHPNVAQYLWKAQKNPFSTTIAAFCEDLLSPECSLTCMLHYPHGTLAGYLKTRSHMTELGLHRVTLDIARGLGFIHQNHLVHNGLSTETVYMSSLSETVGIRSVIGDFERSYEVSENTLRKSPLDFERTSYMLDSCSFGSLYSISQQMDLDNNKFAPDIRSFGMIVLEMLITLGEFDEHSGIGIHYRSKDVKRDSLYDNASLISSQSQPPEPSLPVKLGVKPRGVMGSDSHLNCQLQRNSPHEHYNPYQQHQQHESCKNKYCKCSPRVTDIRALRHRNTDSPLYNGARNNDGDLHIVDNKLTRSSRSPSQDGNKLFYLSSTSLEDSSDNRSIRSQGSFVRKGGDLLPVQANHKRDVQSRDLPPVPPKSKLSGAQKKAKNTVRRPSCDIIRAAKSDLVTAKPPPSPHGDKTPPPPALQLDGTTTSSSQDYDFSPSSDDFYSLSVGSLGSFETIYEDESERSTQGGGSVKRSSTPHHYHTSSTGTRGGGPKIVTGKPPVFKRKDDTFQRKRYSISSANESVFSSDSGVGSYASDTYSDVYTHRLWRDMHRGRRDLLESPDDTYQSKSQRQQQQAPPPSTRRRQPTNICASDPGFSSACQTDSSNTDTLSSEDATYERIGAGVKLNVDKLNDSTKHGVPGTGLMERSGLALMTSSADSLRIPMKEFMSEGAHPIIKQQYSRFAVPRLGISAVLARRLSDASLNSLNSHRSNDVPHTGKDIRKSNTDMSLTVSNKNLATLSKEHELDGKTPSSETNEELSSPDTGNGTSLSSSIRSIIQDSNALLLEAEQAASTKASVVSRPLSEPFIAPCPLTKSSKHSINSSKASLTKAQLDHHNELTKLSKFLDCVSLEQKEKARMLSMLKLVSRNDRLGFIGQQLMSLFSDCWLEDPVPSADEILNRLNLVLPSASV